MPCCDKLMQQVDDLPLLRRQAKALCAMGLSVTATLHPGFPGRRIALYGLPVNIVTVADADAGMSASIRAGMAALPDQCSAVMIVLADMPDLTQADFRAMIDAFDGETVLRGATAEGGAGLPVIFPRACFADLLALSGDRGGRSVAEAHGAHLLPLPGQNALVDLDTEEDWANWRAARGKQLGQ